LQTEDSLTAHLKSKLHTSTEYLCPECHRSFKAAAALIDHFDSASTSCHIRSSQMYQDAVEVASGSFLLVKEDDRGRREQEVNAPMW